MSKTGKIILISVLAVVVLASAVLVPLFATNVTVTLDYCIVEGSSYSRILGFKRGTDIIYNVEVRRFSAYSPPKPIYEDYIFQGWYRDAGYTVAWVNGDRLTSDITLYAKWKNSE